MVCLKLDRLMSILVVLLRRERVRAKELAEMFEVSVRTILRDINTLDLAGIPIVTYQGLGGGIGIAEGFRLDKSILTGDEMATIITALRSLTTTISSSKHEILIEKFKNTLSTTQANLLNSKVNHFIVDLSPWDVNPQLKEKVDALHQAIENCREICFTYTDSEGVRTYRTIEPYSLVLKAQKWYIYGWCLKRKDFRLFKLARTKDLVVTDKVFLPKDVSLEDFPWERKMSQTDNMIELQLIVEKEMITIAEEWFHTEGILQDDGRLLLSVMLPESNWLYGFLLSFGTGLEVIHPPHIRRNLAKAAGEIQKKYS